MTAISAIARMKAIPEGIEAAMMSMVSSDNAVASGLTVLLLAVVVVVVFIVKREEIMSCIWWAFNEVEYRAYSQSPPHASQASGNS
jgi:hypothetical protein